MKKKFEVRKFIPRAGYPANINIWMDISDKTINKFIPQNGNNFIPANINIWMDISGKTIIKFIRQNGNNLQYFHYSSIF